MTARHAFVSVISGVVFSAVMSADALVMRDGRRIQGELIGVRGVLLMRLEVRG